MLKKIKMKFDEAKKHLEIYKHSRKLSKTDLDNELVLFLGFDFRYAGNSKYLFDYLISKNVIVKFVTTDQRVNANYRIDPLSDEFYVKLSQAKVVIAESWIPIALYKKKNQKWIQLWHGTPFKKMLFDTYLQNGTVKERLFLKRKHREIKKWDYVLADSYAGAEKLGQSFRLEENRILTYGYPRVQWLKDCQEEIDKREINKREICNTLGIQYNKKVLLYVPTWRGNQYINNERAYLLDFQLLIDKLPDYQIVMKRHPISKDFGNYKGVVMVHDLIDIQELLLISDGVISDYSSVIFDAMAINRPIYIYMKDLGHYQKYQGIYEDIYQDLQSFVVNNELDLIEKIKNESSGRVYDSFIRNHYTSVEMSHSIDRLYIKIKQILED